MGSKGRKNIKKKRKEKELKQTQKAETEKKGGRLIETVGEAIATMRSKKG